jgi:hypothetical protein
MSGDLDEREGQATMALSSMADILALDGYELRVVWPQGSPLELAVAAGVDACEDCLIPIELFRSMAADKLKDNGLAVPESNIQVRYPADT